MCMIKIVILSYLLDFLSFLDMRYVAAYLLAALGGNKNPSVADIEKILGSVGIEVDQERAKKVISELNGKDVNNVIESGKNFSMINVCFLFLCCL